MGSLRTAQLLGLATVLGLLAASGCGSLLGLDDVGDGAGLGGGGMSVASSSGAAGGSTEVSVGSGGAGGGGSEAWSMPGFNYRRRLTIEGSSTPLGAAVMVRLDDTRINYAAMQSNGDDLRFVNLAGIDLPYEMDTWDPTGVSIVWLSVPFISADVELWMYYGSADAENREAPSEVWAGYHAVLHMDGTLPLTDSTGNDNFGAPVGTEDWPGQLGNAQLYRDANDSVSMSQTANMDNVFEGGATLSAWIYADTAGGSGYGRIIDKSGNTDALDGWSLQLHGALDTYRFERDADGGKWSWNAAGTPLVLSAWQHIVMSWQQGAGAPQFYVNGVAAAAVETDSAGTNWADDATQRTAIGNLFSPSGVAFNGVIDELRVHAGMMTEPEVLYDYRSMDDQLVSFGSEERYEAP
jgi:hypothetical protein